MKKTLLLTFFLVCMLAALAAQEPKPAPASLPANPAAQEPQPASATPNATAAPAAQPKPDEESKVIPKGSKVFIAAMPDSFNEYLKAAFQQKKVPVTLVDDRDQADYEVTGYSETQKAGAAKKIIMGSWHSRESASIKVANLKTGIVAFGYSYNNNDSAHGKKSSAESCAKHLKEKIESGK